MRMTSSRTWVLVLSLAVAGCGGGSSSGGGTESPEGSSGGEESGDGTAAGQPGGSGESAAGGSSAGAMQVDAPKEGMLALESRTIEMQFDLTLLKDGSPAGMQSGSWSVYEERTLKVLGTGDDAIQKLELSYGRREAKALLGVEKPSLTAGKVYVVESGGSVKRSGKDAPGGEKSAVEAEYGWVGSQSPLVGVIRELKPGASAEPPADARRALIGELPSVDHEQSKVEMKLVSVDTSGRKTAKLDVKLESELDNGDMSFTLALAGPAQVDLSTGLVKSLDLSGTVKAKGSVKHKKKPMEARGKGTIKIARKAEFR
jgi:hypothetical protein